MQKEHFVKFVLALISFVIGCLIYLFYRQETFLVACLPNEWVPSPCKLTFENIFLAYFFLYCLADGLWYFAFLQFQVLAFTGTNLSKLVLVFSTMLPFVLEVLQALGWIAGTFDWFDVITYGITLILIIWTNKTTKFGTVFKLPYS